MTTRLMERQAPEVRTARLQRDAANQVGRLVGTTIRLAVDPTLEPSERKRALGDASRDQQQVVGWAWLHLAIESIRNPSPTTIAAEDLLREVLDVDAPSLVA